MFAFALPVSLRIVQESSPKDWGRKEGREGGNEGEALETKTEFTINERDSFGLSDLHAHDYIKAHAAEVRSFIIENGQTKMPWDLHNTIQSDLGLFLF